MKCALWMSMVVAAAQLTATRPVSACTTDSPSPGLELGIDIFDPWPITRSGVLMVRAEAFTVDIDAALADILLWEVRRDEVVVPGAFEVVPLWDREATSDSGEWHVFALIWRADAPLPAEGVYTLDHEVVGPFGSAPRRMALEVVTDVAPTLPKLFVSPTTAEVDPTEVVCCETGLDSCGRSKHCEATRATLLPAIELELDAEGDAAQQQVLWVARLQPGGEPGPRVQGRYASYTGPNFWVGEVAFDAPAGQYCVVVGATSVNDGSEVVSEPQCFDQARLGVPREAELEPGPLLASYDPENLARGECVGPLVYEADGAAYPRGSEAEPEAGGGCSVTPRGSAAPRSVRWLLLLALIRRRRARA